MNVVGLHNGRDNFRLPETLYLMHTETVLGGAKPHPTILSIFRGFHKQKKLGKAQLLSALDAVSLFFRASIFEDFDNFRVIFLLGILQRRSSIYISSIHFCSLLDQQTDHFGIFLC